MANFLDAYIQGNAAVRHLFGPSPESVRSSIPTPRPWDPAFTEALQALQPKLGLTRQFRGDEPVVITGQQPVLFLGPMYILYKTITAIRLAREIRENTGAPCLPVFWIASEDHDFEEVRRFWYADASGSVRERLYTPTDESGRPIPVSGLPMHKVPIDPQLAAFIDELSGNCLQSELAGPVTELLRSTLAEAPSVSNWFARMIAALFKDTDLILIAPHMRTARAAAAPILRREIEAPLESTRLLMERGQLLTDMGYAPAIVRAPDACNFFLMVEGKRRKVFYNDHRFQIPEEPDLSYNQAELLALLDSRPECFSPNVALRPVVQQTLFPSCIAYVGGPGEIAYWAQLKPIFDYFGVAMPAVYPRARACFITPKERRRLQAFGLTRADLTAPRDELVDRALHTAPAPGREVITRHRPGIAAAWEGLIDSLTAAPGVGPDAVDFARNLAEQSDLGLERLERLLQRQDKVRVDTVTRQIDQLRERLMPMGRPQERVLSPFTFFFSQGLALVDRLLQELRADYQEEQEIEWQ